MALELDIFEDTTAEDSALQNSVMEAERSLYGQDSMVGRQDYTVGDDGNYYNKDGEQVYYWVRPRETDSTMSDTGAETMGIGQDRGGYYTEEEIRAAWDAKEGMGYLKQQTDWDNYWGFISERQGLIQTGDLPDPTTAEYMADYPSTDSDLYPTGPAPTPNVGSSFGGGRDEEIYYGQQAAAGQDASNTAMTAWVEMNSALMNKYGIPAQYQNKDGDLFLFNGSTFTRSFKAEGPDYGKVVAAVMVGAFTAGAAGPAVSAAFGGGAAGGAATGVVSSVISQGIVNGKIDPSAVVTSGILSGLGGWFNDLRAATPGAYGGWVIDGTQVGNASQWMIEKTQYLSDLLGIPFNEASGIVEGVLAGTVSGEDLEGIALNAVGGWSQVKVKDYLSDIFGEGVDVDNWFREGDSFIPTEAVFPFVEAGIQAAIDGGVSKTELLKMLGGYFQAGGDLDFILPGLPDLDLESAFPDLGFDFCEQYPDFPGLCKDIDGNGLNIELDEFGCTIDEEFNTELGKCVPKVDITVDEFGCTIDEEFNTELGKCVPKGDITVPEITCPDGQEYNTELGKCIDIEVPEITCPNGQEYNTELGECVDIEVPKVGSLEALCSQPRPEEYGFGQINWDKYCKVPEINCPDGQEYNTELGECVDIKVPETTCPKGFRNEDGECVKIEGPDVDVDVDVDASLPSVSLGQPSSGMFTSKDPMGLSYEQQTPVAITAGQPQNAMTDLNDFISRQLQKRDRMLT
jgi:hypothetical protein